MHVTWQPTRQLVLLLLLGLFLSTPAHAAERAALLEAMNSITGSELRAHVDVLADDSFEGREAGKPGGRAAAGYLRDRLQESGLQGAGDQGAYYQVFGNGYRNVLGLLEGSDPQLKHQIIVVGGHYDHVGYGTRNNSLGPWGYVHNGADDNASGTAGLLELMDALLRLPNRPRRSILLAFWDGEEKGLLGSKHWTTHPTLPLARVTFAVNVDMIGRLREQRLKVYGTRSGWGLRRLLATQNHDHSLRLDFDWTMKSNSDHHSFFAREIPVLMFHTGLHDDYHRPSDDAHLVNVAGMEQVTRLMFAVVHELAQRDHVTTFRADAAQESKRQRTELESELKQPPPRLGVSWSRDVSEGISVTNVRPDSAADRAAVQIGDRIISFDGEPVADSQSLRRRVLRAAARTTIRVQRDSAAEPLTLDVELPGKPTRVGVSWRTDGGEPGTAVVSRVVAGSAAALAGMKAGDRIYAVDGNRFEDSAGLLDKLKTLPSPLEVTVEREGRVRQVTLELPEPLGERAL